MWYEDHATWRVHLYLTSVSQITFQFCSGICCVQLCFYNVDAPLVFYDFTNKFFTPIDLSDSATTDFGFKQTKTEPQSPRLHTADFLQNNAIP